MVHGETEKRIGSWWRYKWKKLKNKALLKGMEK